MKKKSIKALGLNKLTIANLEVIGSGRLAATSGNHDVTCMCESIVDNCETKDPEDSCCTNPEIGQ